MKNTELLKSLIREPYLWPGGYERFSIMNDGGVVCWKCCRDNFNLVMHSTMFKCADGWQVVAVDNVSNVDGNIWCDHCYTELN